MVFTSAVALLVASAGFVSAATHQIVVGGTSGLVFTPSNITAAKGDIVTFEFQSKNHSVTQSSFAAPCTLLQNATTNQVGFDSGLVPVSVNATQFPAWSIEITDDAAPIWFYCKQKSPAPHCESGMVGSINAATTGPKTFDAFKALALSLNGTAASSASGTTGSAGGSGVGASASGSVSDPAPTGDSSTSGTGSGSSGSQSTGAAGTVKVASTGLALSLVAAVACIFA